MDVWSLSRIVDRLEEQSIAIDREAMQLARWIWEDILLCHPAREREFSVSEEATLFHVFERLTAGEPIQYIAGHAWFYGFKFIVNRHVLIPRPETEELVEWIGHDHRKPGPEGLRILDIGCGSGCIAITLYKLLQGKAAVTGIDISLPALEVAKENSRRLETDVKWLFHNFLEKGFDGLGTFDVIVSNPPYISQDLADKDILQALRYEPEFALYPPDGDPDVFYRKILLEAMGHLVSGGSCYVELNEFRAEDIMALAIATGWQHVEIRHDMQGLPRMLKVVRP